MMKHARTRLFVLGTLSVSLVGGCASQASELDRGYALGQAVKATIAAQSIRDVEVPNSKGLAGTSSGDRAVAAVERLSNGEVAQPTAPTLQQGRE